MLGLAAAPEMAIAVPSLAPFLESGRLAPAVVVDANADSKVIEPDKGRVKPAYKGVIANERALRVCNASSFPQTTFKLVFKIGNGRSSTPSTGCGGICRLARGMSSSSEKPVKGCGRRPSTEAPR